MTTKLETRFQRELIRDLEVIFPGCIILKNDPTQIQGIPDLVILWGPYWAALEVKADAISAIRPNQEYYIDLMGEMSFAAFIYPENKEDILNALQSAFGAFRAPRFS